MRKFIDIINEGAAFDLPGFGHEEEDEKPQMHPSDMAGDPNYFSDKPRTTDWRDLLANHVRKTMMNSTAIHRVYGLVLDGIPFDDAVKHVAQQLEIDTHELRSLVVADYKKLRHKYLTTHDPIVGSDPHAEDLIHVLNPIIREWIESLK